MIFSNNQNGISFYGNTRNGYLYIQNNYIFSNTINNHNSGSGIYARSDNNTVIWQNSHIYNNTITSNQNGIEFLRLKNHIVYINNISNNTYDGVLLDSSNYNTISYNKIANNNWSGANITASSGNNKIQNNNLTSNNFTGVFINGNSNYNTITRNDILNHPRDGVNVTSSSENYLHHNNFKGNSQNAYDSTTQLNDWDDSAEGNWWDDYTGFDSNNDGIGDIPYDVPGGGSKDWYPIIKPANIVAPHVENTTPPDSAFDIPVSPKISVTFSMEMNITFTESSIAMSGGLTPQNFVWSNGGMTVTFEPSTTLSSKTSYTLTISIFARDILGNQLENTYQFSFTTKDIIPPTIKATSPVHSSIEIALNSSIVVTFSEAMNGSTISYYCSPDPGSWSVLWSNQNSVATFSHNDFGSTTTYTFRITAGKDLGGNDQIASSTPNPWTFTTKDVIGPEITSTYPANGTTGVLLSANIVVTFNEKMNTSSVTYSCTLDPGGWNIAWSNNDKTATYSHNAFNTQVIYTFQIKAGKDLAGNTLNPSIPNPWSFTTKDTVPPNITATSPSCDSGGVPLNGNIIVTFSEAMDDATVTHICNPNPGGWSVLWSGSNTVATYSHNLFSQNTNYTFQITGGKDLAGNNIVSGSVLNPFWFSTQDSTPPQILATTPINGSDDIKLDANIVITFSETMNTASVTYTCSPDPGGCSVKWNAGNTKATYSHNLFGSTTKYSFKITSGKDLSRNNLILSSSLNPFSFTTKDALPPSIISVSPQDAGTDIVLSSNIVVTFNEPMDTANVTFTCSPNPAGWTVVWDAEDAVATFMHDPFERFTTYSFQITNAKDLANNDLASGSIPNPWSFTTMKNAPPSILSQPLKTATEKIQYSYDVEAFDSNNDIITYSLITQPIGMTIDNLTGKINWTPANAQVGENFVQILVSDGFGGIDIQSFNITVENVNDPPSISSTPITIATEKEPYAYKVEATDIDASDVLIYSLQIAHTGMTINSATGLLSWVPTNDDVGVRSVTVQVSDGNGGTDSQGFTIDVANANDQPMITSSPIVIGKEDARYTYDVEAYDVDINDKLTFSLITQPDEMIIDSSTGLITWTPTNEQTSIIPITVKVTDEIGSSVTQSFNILVSNVNDPPEITSTPITSSIEDTQYLYEVIAKDIDPTNDILTFSLKTHPLGMEIDPKSGLITWEPTDSQIGQNDVAIIVSDGNDGTALQIFTIDVMNVNDLPIITSTAITTATEGKLYTYDVDATDADIDDTLDYILDNYPSGMEIDSDTGLITWLPTNDQVGVISVTIKVVDSSRGSAEQSFPITISNTNDAPEITSTPVTSATVGSEYVYDTNALDIDPTGDQLMFSLTTYPSGMIIDPVTGNIIWTPTKDQTGTNNIVVLVSDGNDGASTQSFTISVNPKPAEVGTVQKKGTQETAIYSIIGLIIVLLIIFGFLLGVFLKKPEQPKTKN